MNISLHKELIIRGPRSIQKNIGYTHAFQLATTARFYDPATENNTFCL